jgi:hypothetical protein
MLETSSFRARCIDITANRLAAGARFINTNHRPDRTYRSVASGCRRQPSLFGIPEFVNIKAVRVV